MTNVRIAVANGVFAIDCITFVLCRSSYAVYGNNNDNLVTIFGL
jgi:hypothetical protein